MKTFNKVILMTLVMAVVGCSANSDLERLLSNDAGLLKDSEFSIIFPNERDPGIRAIQVTSKSNQINALLHGAHETRNTVTLASSDFLGFVSKLRELKEKEFTSDKQHDCFKRFELRIRVGHEQRKFTGCRGPGANAEAMSRAARNLEFTVMKRTSS